MDIKVIASEKDGRELRDLQKGRYLRCDGKDDQHEINEALAIVGRGAKYWSLGDAWERIFGRRR